MRRRGTVIWFEWQRKGTRERERVKAERKMFVEYLRYDCDLISIWLFHFPPKFIRHWFAKQAIKITWRKTIKPVIDMNHWFDDIENWINQRWKTRPFSLSTELLINDNCAKWGWTSWQAVEVLFSFEIHYVYWRLSDDGFYWVIVLVCNRRSMSSRERQARGRKLYFHCTFIALLLMVKRWSFIFRLH